MQFEKNGITITVAEEEIRRLVLERLSRDVSVTHVPGTPLVPPRIGAEWSAQGGIYAGVARGRDGADYYLIVGPEYEGEINWDDAQTWATSLKLHGFTDYTLPYRTEQSITFGNTPKLFRETSYWSCEQPAAYSSRAWNQVFDYGSQASWVKSLKLRARVVRRIPLQ